MFKQYLFLLAQNVTVMSLSLLVLSSSPVHMTCRSEVVLARNHRPLLLRGAKRLPRCLIMLTWCTLRMKQELPHSISSEIMDKKWKPPKHIVFISSIPFVVWYASMNLLDQSKFNMRYLTWTKFQWFGTLQTFPYRKPQMTSDPGTALELLSTDGDGCGPSR